MKDFTSRIVSRIGDEENIFKTRIKGFFKYEKENMATLKEVIDVREKVHSNFSRNGCPSLSGSVKAGTM